jgi:hypothetical protein
MRLSVHCVPSPFAKLCASLCTLVSNWIFSEVLMEVTRSTLSTIVHFRNQFLQENDIQFVLDKCHRYGWADTYLLTNNGEQVGYGSVWGKDKREDRDAIFEFYLIEPARNIYHVL